MKVENTWVTDTASNTPGILDLEAIVTDSDGNVESERFWVNVPYTPPPPPGVPVPPRFKDVLKFREDFGLEVVFPVADENELNERIFDLLHAWHSPQTPAGEVARASWEQWGVPMRPKDVAEMELREWFYDANADRIDQWVEANNPGNYAGYYLDHAAGGIMHIGFTEAGGSSQESQLTSMQSALGLEAWHRLGVYPVAPTISYMSVRATSVAVYNAIEGNATLAGLIADVEDDEAGKTVRIGTANVAQVETILDQMIGANAPITVEFTNEVGTYLNDRYQREGRMRAGHYMAGQRYGPNGELAGWSNCTSGFGAEDVREPEPGNKIVRIFVLTAGHCFQGTGDEVWRSTDESGNKNGNASKVGNVGRSAFQYVGAGGVRTDAEGI